MTSPATSIYWHFPILIVTVSLVYSATRFERWDHILREALYWGLRMTGFLAAIGVGLALVHVLPWWLFLSFLGAMAFGAAVLSIRRSWVTPPP